MIKFLARLPHEVIGIIQRFCYSPQPPALCEDIRSYADIRSLIVHLYESRFGVTQNARDWLTNDIARFLNNDLPTLYGYQDLYLDVFKRLYANQKKSKEEIHKYVFYIDGLIRIKDYTNTVVGLLSPKEREQLVTFLVTL